MYFLFLSSVAFLTVSISALDANNVQCIQTCKNLGCLSGIYFPQSMTVSWPNHPVGCTCVVCNNNVQCNNNQDAMNYCQGILGCQGQDCDGGLVECLTCPSTPAVKFQRSDYSANNAKCNMACIKNGCQAGFVNQFSTAPGVPIVNCTCAICLPNQQPCTENYIPTITNFCQSIGCAAAANNPNGAWNQNKWPNQNNACDFGVAACFSCPY